MSVFTGLPCWGVEGREGSGGLGGRQWGLDTLQCISYNQSVAAQSRHGTSCSQCDGRVVFLSLLDTSTRLWSIAEQLQSTYQKQDSRKIYHIDWCILNEVNVILLNPTDLNIKMERKRKIYISVLTFLAILPSYISTAHLDGEAAFQGREHGSWSILISTCVNTFLAAGQVLLFNVAFRDLLCIQRLFAETVLCLSKGSHQWFVVLETKITKFSSHF